MEEIKKSKNAKIEITITGKAKSEKEEPTMVQIENLHDFVFQLFKANKEQIENIFNDGIALKYDKTKKGKTIDPYLSEFSFESDVHEKVK